MILLLWYNVHVRQMTMNIKVMKRCFANWRYLMHLVKLICFASVTYQACFVSPLSMVKPNEASQNCYIKSKRVRFNTPPISIWSCTRHLYCLHLENKFVYARKISLYSVGTSVAKEAPNFIASGIIERRYVNAIGSGHYARSAIGSTFGAKTW